MISESDAHSGIFWSAVSRITIHVFQIITLIVLARLLEPAEFGLITSSVVVIGFLNIFKDLGIAAAIIQRKEVSDEFLSSIYWVVLSVGILMNILLYFSAHGIAEFYNAEELTNILKVLSFTFPITSATIMHQTLLEKDLKFKQIAFYETFAVIVGSVSAIVLAFMGFGVWSLVIQSLANAATLSMILWLKSSFKPKFLFSFTEVKSIYNFSANLSGFNIVNYFVRNADYVLIQKYLGQEQLGYYNIAYRMMLYPLQNITAVFSRVMFPFYSKLQGDNPKIREMYIKLVNNIAMISFPLMLWITATSDVLIKALLGGKWLVTIPILIILAPIGMIQSVYTPAGTIFKAKGRTDIWFLWGLVTGVIFVTAFVIGLRWGIFGVALGYLIANLITIYPGLVIPLKLIDLPVGEFVASFGKTFIISICMFILIYLIKILLIKQLTSIELFIILIVSALLFYVPVSFRFNRQKVNELLTIIKAF